MAETLAHSLHHVRGQHRSSDLSLVKPRFIQSAILMTESLAHVVPDLVLEKLDSILAQGIGPPMGQEIETELKTLRATVSAIQDLVLVAEGHHILQKPEGSSELGIFLYNLTQAMDSISNLLNELQLQVLRPRKSPQRTHFWVSSLFLRSDSLPSTNISRRIEEARKKLEEIKKKGGSLFSRSNSLATISHFEDVRKQLRGIASEKLNLNSFKTAVDMHASSRYYWKREMTQSSSDVIGRGRDQKIIIQLLRRSVAGENVSVLPIVGVGGIGKTTLTKRVYDDVQIAAHFHKRMWVYVSEIFNITKIIKEIIQSATGEKCGDLTLDQLQARLRHILDGTRFLLILDDVWNRDREKWLKLRALLMGGANGSKIVVTTRKIGVAPIMGTIQTYVLSPLPSEGSWSLFRKHACRQSPEGPSSDVMEVLGRQIVDKCGGNPLQLRMLGSLMYYSGKGAEDWTSVRDDATWKSEYFPALKLSYEKLPSHLKPCFAFCSIFPKHSEIRSDDLVQLWIMHDLIKPTTTNHMELEEIGNEYIKELWRRSFFQDLEEREHGACFGIRIHDLVHGLAVSVAQKENAMVTFGAKNIPREIRHVSFSDEDWSSHEQRVQTFLGKLAGVQTILFPVDGVGLNGECESIINTCLERFTSSLLLLDLSYSRFKALPESISSLTKLKYLSLKRNDRIVELPDSISQLRNLETLDLGGCSGLEKLPKSIELLEKLRHLVITTKEEALRWLKSMKSLRYLGLVGCVNLKYLFGEWENFTALRSLFIHRCPSLVSLPRGIRALSALKILRINDCETLDLVDDCDDGEVPGFESLRLLVIVKLPRLERLPKWILQAAASASNTTLQHVVIEHCPNFRGLPQEVLQNFDSFHKFKVEDCPQAAGQCPRRTQDKSTRIFRTHTLPGYKNPDQLKLLEEVNNMKLKSSPGLY